MRFWTKVLTSGSITISNTDFAYQVSVQANDTSSCTVSGNNIFQGIEPDNITLANGESLTLSAPTNSPIDGITITWTGGTIDVIIGC